jgi:hypothetical protein
MTDTITAELDFTLPVPPGQAFDVLSDPIRDPEWQASCVHTRLINGEPRPGCHYEITFQLVGRKMTFTVEIIAFEPGVRSAFKVIDGPFTYVGSYDYREPTPGTTDVHWSFAVEPGDYFGIMPTVLLKKILVSQVKKDSRRLADQLAANGRVS